jgi:hypothetical protein
MTRELDPEWSRHPVRTAVVGTGVAGYSWLAGGVASFTTAATVAVAIPWVVLGLIACCWPPKRIPPPDRLDVTGTSYWAMAAIVFFEWEAAGFRDGSLWWHPTLSVVTGPLLDYHTVKSAAFAAWLMAGWGLIRR